MKVQALNENISKRVQQSFEAKSLTLRLKNPESSIWEERGWKPDPRGFVWKEEIKQGQVR